LLLDREQRRGSWQRQPAIPNALQTFPVPALNNRANPSGGVAEHHGDLFWRVVLPHQPQDMPVGPFDEIGCTSIPLMKLFLCQLGLDRYSFGHTYIIHSLNGFDIIRDAFTRNIQVGDNLSGQWVELGEGSA
jgi:hypothetical protein